MDYRVKVVNSPSIRDAVKKHKRADVNGLRFGYSDKLEAVVSEPATEADIRSFRQVPGFVIIDAVTGDLISSPDKIHVTEADVEPDATGPATQPPVKKDPNEVWAEGFIRDFREASESERKRIGNDEYKRVLRVLKVNVEPDATKADMIALLDELATEQDGDGSEGGEE